MAIHESVREGKALIDKLKVTRVRLREGKALIDKAKDTRVRLRYPARSENFM